MNHDQNRKSLRQFQCRDYLWEIFEQMSGELECSVDYLINESMRQYAKSRNYGGSRSPAAPPAVSGRPAIPSAPPPPARSGGYAAPPPPASGPAFPPPPARGSSGGFPPPPSGSYATSSSGSMPAGSIPPPTAPTPTPPPASYGGASPTPPPLPGGGASVQVPAARSPLFVIFNGQKFPVAKDEFIIGRGSKTADLPIKDGNISRRHAAVIWQNGGWFVKDLGSTNGVEHQGRKIDSKRVEEGDVFQLCDYEIRFTYR